MALLQALYRVPRPLLKLRRPVTTSVAGRRPMYAGANRTIRDVLIRMCDYLTPCRSGHRNEFPSLSRFDPGAGVLSFPWCAIGGQMGRFANLNRRVLVVDDDPNVAPPIEAVARRLRFDVMTRSDGFYFERVVGNFRPTIIFLDLALPGRDGLELVGSLVANSFSGKLVVMSGWDVAQIQLVSTLASAQGLIVAGTLPKPFRVHALVELLSKAAGQTVA